MPKSPTNPEIWPTKAYKNMEFLNSPRARAIRVQCELEEPAQRFERNNIENTIVCFGSARTLPTEVANERLASLEAEFKEETTLSTEQKEALRKAKADAKAAPYYDDAREFARLITEWSNSKIDPKEKHHIMSGGGPGIMEAANRGALEAEGNSIGLGISLPFEQGINDYCTDDLSFEFHYFFVRKYWFLYMAKAIVVFPGGFGTMDELFEMLTLIQTRKTLKFVPIVLYGTEFWKKLINFDTFIEWGVISPEDLDLFQFMDDPKECADYLIDTLSHYQTLEKKS